MAGIRACYGVGSDTHAVFVTEPAATTLSSPLRGVVIPCAPAGNQTLVPYLPIRIRITFLEHPCLSTFPSPGH